MVGGGGREHALAWKASQSPVVQKVYVAPGNAGTGMEGGMENVPLGAEDISGLLEFATDRKIDLTIIGPEAALVSGIVDRFDEAGLKCFGPTAAAAQLEGSKTFTKEFLLRHRIPTAEYRSFTDLDAAIAYFDSCSLPCVIKADGLAAGKGVVIAAERQQGIDAIESMLAGNAFGEAGSRVVVEEFLEGEEASFICMVDGSHTLAMASSQDHKAAYDGDNGPNTGGMGAYSPAPVLDQALHQRVMTDIMEPTVAGMAKEGTPYLGFLYAGLMIDHMGNPKVLEFNCRFGDPETQPIMMRLKSDLVELCLAALEGRLDGMEAKWDARVSMGVVMAAQGYPGKPNSGDEITGLGDMDDPAMKVFHAGTREENGDVVTSGGRVLCATALGKDIAEAQRLAYRLADSITWKGCWYRRDIGYRGIARESGNAG